MQKLRRLTFSIIVIFLFSGCTTRLVDFTILSTKNVKVPTNALDKRVKGEDCVFVFLVPFGIVNMKEAVDRAIESAGPGYDALVDGVLYHQNNSFLVGQICYVIEGTAINTKTSVSWKQYDNDSPIYHSQRSTDLNEG